MSLALTVRIHSDKTWPLAFTAASIAFKSSAVKRTIANMVITMMTTQLIVEGPIDIATKRNARIFAAYIVVLILTALIIAVFTWLTWDSGNKLQDAIRRESDARIQEAKQGVEQLKNDNLALSGQVAELQDEAGKQQERAAKAERALLELREKINPRRLLEAQKQTLARLLSSEAPISPRIFAKFNVPDGDILGDDFEDVFHRLGWSVPPTNRGNAMFSNNFSGVLIAVHDKSGPSQAKKMQDALKAIGIDAPGVIDQTLPVNTFEIRIGDKN